MTTTSYCTAYKAHCNLPGIFFMFIIPQFKSKGPVLNKKFACKALVLTALLILGTCARGMAKMVACFSTFCSISWSQTDFARQFLFSFRLLMWLSKLVSLLISFSLFFVLWKAFQCFLLSKSCARPWACSFLKGFQATDWIVSGSTWNGQESPWTGDDQSTVATVCD